MSESEVKNVVNTAIKEYDQQTALPRHREIIEEMSKMRAEQGAMRSGQDQLLGAATFGKWMITIVAALLGLPGSVFMILQIVRALR